MWNFILKTLKPFIVFIGRIHSPFSRKKITGKHYYQWRKSIEVGTVLLTKTNGEFSNLFNPAKIKHAGIYIGKIDSEVRYVLEAVGRGVVLTDLVTFLTTKDIVVGCKPKFIDEKFSIYAKESAKMFEGVPYDFLFNKGDDAFYCFELCASILMSAYSEVSLNCEELIKGRRIYSEDTFLDLNYFDIAFDSRSEK